MKKLIIVLAAGMFVADSMAQVIKAPPPLRVPAQAKDIAAPPPSPVPPQEVDFPVPPPPPPVPPPGPQVGAIKFNKPSAVNEKGYAILIKRLQGDDPFILLTKKGVTQKIRMSIWNAKPGYFENKYGQLPPPPPAPPVVCLAEE